MLIALINLQGQLQNNTYYIDDIENVFSQNQRELIDLQEKGVITRLESNSYRFTTSVIESVIIQKIYENREIGKRQKWQNLLSRQQMKGIENLTKAVSQTKAMELIMKLIEKKLLGGSDSEQK